MVSAASGFPVSAVFVFVFVFVFVSDWYQRCYPSDESFETAAASTAAGLPLAAAAFAEKSVFAREQLFVSGVKQKYSNFVIKCTFQARPNKFARILKT